MLQNVHKSTASVLALLTLTISLSACSTTPQSIEYTPTPIDRPTLILPTTDVLSLKKVDWIVITPENVVEELRKLTSGNQPVSLFSLTSDGYTALSINMAQLLELLSQQKAVIVAYDTYYNQAEEQFDTVE